MVGGLSDIEGFAVGEPNFTSWNQDGGLAVASRAPEWMPRCC
jgi:hypothetical protein